MKDATISLLVDGAVSEIVLARPEKRNALRPHEVELLASHLDDVEKSAARCLILRGAGGSFCAGRDISDADPATEDNEALIRDVINPVLQKLYEFPLPTLAIVEGPCLGLGFGLALACDIALVAENALLGSPFRRIGSIPDSGAHFFLSQRIGPHRAAELIFSGRLISGREAAAIGLVNKAYGALDLSSAGRALAVSIASGPTEAFKLSKAILRQHAPYPDTLRTEAVYQAQAVRTEDGLEGFRAFQEKREPFFVGR